MLLSRIRIGARAATESPGFLSELREGSKEFTSRTWLWASVVFFGMGNFVFAGWIVLGPLIAKEELGGAGPWAVILSSFGVGAVIGSLVAIRLRPRRPLVACVVAAVPLSLQTLTLALATPAWVVAAAAFVAGIGLSIHLTLWFTVFQREVPERSSPASRRTTRSARSCSSRSVWPSSARRRRRRRHNHPVGGGRCDVGVWAAILALPSVWAIRQAPSQPTPAAA